MGGLSFGGTAGLPVLLGLCEVSPSRVNVSIALSMLPLRPFSTAELRLSSLKPISLS